MSIGYLIFCFVVMIVCTNMAALFSLSLCGDDVKTRDFVIAEITCIGISVLTVLAEAAS